MKKLISICLSVLVIITLTAPTLLSSNVIADAFLYDADAAIAFASSHCSQDAQKYPSSSSSCINGWKCAEFVSECLVAGGFSTKLSANVETFANQIVNYGKCISSTKTGSGYVYTSSFNGVLSKGDPIVILYSSGSGHVVICSGETSDGVPLIYAHNSRKQNQKLYISDNYSAYKVFAVHIESSTNSSTPSVSYTSTNPDDYIYPTFTIKYTSPTTTGSEVAWIQAVLYRLGYSISIDGKYGPSTKAVVEQFQSDYGLTVDGSSGPETRSKLLELWNNLKHSHSYQFTRYRATHPHNAVYTCSCSASYIDTSVTRYDSSCSICTGVPTKPVITDVYTGTSAEYCIFNWSTGSSTDYCEVHFYDNNTGEKVLTCWGTYTNYYSVQLPAGSYCVVVTAVNQSLINSGYQYYMQSDAYYFNVSNGSFTPVDNTTYNGNKYVLYDITLPYPVAEAKCKELGGHLVTITSAEEQAAISALVKNNKKTAYWMGLTDAEAEGVWKLSTGEDLIYTNWVEGEPNDSQHFGGEDYGIIYRKDYGGAWNDANAYIAAYSIGFICEFDSAMFPSSTTTYNGNKYVLYDVTLPYSVAEEKCKEIGGHLVTITSAEEQEAVYEMVKSNNKTAYWMGLTDAETEGVWKFSTGEELTYTNWMYGEPNNSQNHGGEDYAVIYNGDDGVWNDVNFYNSWTASTGFICEYEPSVITFDANGGENTPIELIKPHDQSISLNVNPPTRDGYVFLGWSTDKDATSATYKSNEIFTSNESTILYAIWKQHVYDNACDTICNDCGFERVIEHNYGEDKICDICGCEKRISGDIDGTGEVGLSDVTFIAQYFAGWDVDCNTDALDVNGDGAVNLKDLIHLARYVAGWDVELS